MCFCFLLEFWYKASSHSPRKKIIEKEYTLKEEGLGRRGYVYVVVTNKN